MLSKYFCLCVAGDIGTVEQHIDPDESVAIFGSIPVVRFRIPALYQPLRPYDSDPVLIKLRHFQYASGGLGLRLATCWLG